MSLSALATVYLRVDTQVLTLSLDYLVVKDSRCQRQSLSVNDLSKGKLYESRAFFVFRDWRCIPISWPGFLHYFRLREQARFRGAVGKPGGWQPLSSGICCASL